MTFLMDFTINMQINKPNKRHNLLKIKNIENNKEKKKNLIFLKMSLIIKLD